MFINNKTEIDNDKVVIYVDNVAELKKLEEELGTILFNRKGSKVELTQTGRELYSKLEDGYYESATNYQCYVANNTLGGTASGPAPTVDTAEAHTAGGSSVHFTEIKLMFPAPFSGSE